MSVFSIVALVISLFISYQPVALERGGTIVSVSSREANDTIALLPYARIPEAPQQLYDDTLGVDVTAVAAVAQDVSSKVILWEKNPDALRSIASITKLATLLVVLDTVQDLAAQVEITGEDYTLLGFQTFEVGDRVSVHDLIAATVITSDNTAANALARITGLSRDAFLAAMTNTVRARGMEKTIFADVNGLSDGNMSTAREVLSLASAAFERPLIRDLSKRGVYTIIKNDTEEFKIYNTNQLIGSMIDIEAGKTGFVTESGYNLVAESVRDGHPILAVVLGSATNSDRFQDYKMLAYWIWEHFAWQE